jgi:hypothetical protein
MRIPTTIKFSDLNVGPKTPVNAYADRFHHVPPLWVYRWLDEEQIGALCRKALEEDRPVESWAIVKYGSWRWNEPPGEGAPPGMRF